jgi:GrpB-like predicted nucleotidyltransferase (UPF0157 family)
MDLLMWSLLASIVVIVALAFWVSTRIKQDQIAMDEKHVDFKKTAIPTLEKKRHYRLENYNPEWHHTFLEMKETLESVFKDKAVSIEHVGSTSVPGMKSVPVVDVLVAVHTMESFVTEKKLMKALGYEWGDSHAAPGTILFYKENEDGTQSENVHVCEHDSPQALQFLYTRDYFITHPERAAEYGELKTKLKQEYPDDYDAYKHGKKNFYDETERWAREWARENNN